VVRIAHLTDIHLAPLPPARARELASKRALGFVSWQRYRRHRHRLEVLDAVLADLSRHDVDHIVVTGDLCNISLDAEFRAAAAWLERLGPPERVTVIPGNHDADVGGAARRGWPLWSAYMGRRAAGAMPTFPFVRDVGPLTFVALSTAVPTPAGYATGRLGDHQLRALERVLGETRARSGHAVVLLHHPPVHGWSHRRKRLVDARGFRRILQRAGADLVLCGHEHVLNVGGLAGPRGTIPVLGGPSASLLGDSAATSGGYLLLEMRARQSGPGLRIDVEARRFDPEALTMTSVMRATVAGMEEAGQVSLEPAT
jgi:3',5'-cyclic AMP phosphodiesterase CpdA